MTQPPSVEFDRLVDEAWPATYAEYVGGWRLRFADGVTKRANSVWPAADPGDPDSPGDLDDAISAAERFYAARGLPAVFSLSADARPADLDGLLAARGYEIVDPTWIMTLELSRVPPVEGDVEIAAVPSAEWLDMWWSVDGRYGSGLGTARDIVTGVAASYAATGNGDAVGRAVRQGDWVGIYCMAVAPPARRRGLARAVLHALLDDAREAGATKAYLSVTARNAAARALYEQAGFEIAGRYHYRVRPA